jgi:pimeloyl-ACP methyl ester carboxylesterase
MNRPSDLAPARARITALSPAALLAVIVACALSVPRPVQGAAPGSLQIPQRQVQPSACPIELAPAIAPRARCGRLTVPEDRAVADGRQVTIHFVVIDAERPSGRDPLLFVMGGNGSGLKMLRRQPKLAAEVTREDTVIFADHRGSTPWGTPDMSCPQFPEGLDAAKPDADPAKVAACRKHLDERLHVNLYGPYEAAQDLRELRLALGLPRWNVYGTSYGTTVAQRLLGLDGGAIGRIVFDGMSGADANPFADAFVIDPLLDLIDECAAAMDCRRTHPDFERQLGSVATALQRRPRSIDGRTVSNVEYLARIREAMADPARRGRIPEAVARSVRGDHRAWAALRNPDAEVLPGGKDPAFTWPSSVCRDEHPWRDDVDRAHPARRAVPESIRKGARLIDDESWDWGPFCARMGFRRSAPETVAVPTSGVPALMLVGALDLVTPKTWNDRTVQSLKDSRTVVFPSTGHYVLLRHQACTAELMRGFFDDPRAPLRTGCVDGLPKTVWSVDGADGARP